jgi:hypothetical protein
MYHSLLKWFSKVNYLLECLVGTHDVIYYTE